MIPRRWRGGILLLTCLLLVALWPPEADAHRSGCHRWHSCPSDQGTYVCGDLGYCSQKPRPAEGQPVLPPPQLPKKGVEPFGKEAKEANRRLVEGKTVRLELDVEKWDKYRRLLAYVYVGETMVDAELVRQGFAQVATYPPNVKYQERFLKLQREAWEAKRGLWR